MSLNYYERKLYEVLKGLTEAEKYYARDPKGQRLSVFTDKDNYDNAIKSGGYDPVDRKEAEAELSGQKGEKPEDEKFRDYRKPKDEPAEKPQPKQTKIAANPFDDGEPSTEPKADQPADEKPYNEPDDEPEIGSDEYYAKQEREAEKHNAEVMQDDPPHPGMSGDWDDAEEINMKDPEVRDEAAYTLAAVAKGRRKNTPVSKLRGMVSGLLATTGIRKFDKNNFATDDGRVLSQYSLTKMIQRQAEKEGYPVSDDEVSNLMDALENRDGSRPDKPEEVEKPETFDTLIDKSRNEPDFWEDEANVEKWNELTTQEDPPPDNASFGPNDPIQWDRARDIADSDEVVDAEHYFDFLVGGVKPEELDRGQLRQDVTATLMRVGGIYPNEQGQWASDDGRILSKGSIARLMADESGMEERDVNYLLDLASGGEPDGTETEYTPEREAELQKAKADREEQEIEAEKAAAAKPHNDDVRKNDPPPKSSLGKYEHDAYWNNVEGWEPDADVYKQGGLSSNSTRAISTGASDKIDRDELRGDFHRIMNAIGAAPNDDGEYATDDGRILSRTSLTKNIAWFSKLENNEAERMLDIVSGQKLPQESKQPFKEQYNRLFESLNGGI